MVSTRNSTGRCFSLVARQRRRGECMSEHTYCYRPTLFVVDCSCRLVFYDRGLKIIEITGVCIVFQNFVVRQSSQTGTMAISVRLPSGKGPYIEHYLIQATADNRLALESSDNKFDSIPMLIAHYAQCW